jgi:hypothetical protein
MKTLIKIFLFLAILQVSAQDSTATKVVINGRLYNLVTGQGLGAAGNDVLTEQSLTANYTMIASDWDSGKKVFYNNTANDYVVTVPDVAQVGEKVIFSQYSTGKIQVGMANGVIGDSFQTIDSTSNITLYKSGAVGYRNVGASNPYTPLVNLYVLANAANPVSDNNATTGIVGTQSVLSVSNDAGLGTNSILATSQGGDFSRFEITITGLEIGVTYTFNFKYKQSGLPQTAGNYPRTVLFQGSNTPAFNFTATTWTEGSYQFVPTATTVGMRWYLGGSGADAAPVTTGQLYFDDARLYKN